MDCTLDTLQVRSLNDDLYAFISESTSTMSTIVISNCISDQNAVVELSPSNENAKQQQNHRKSPVRVASFDGDTTAPPSPPVVIRRIKPEDTAAPESLLIEPTTTTATTTTSTATVHYAVRKHDKSTTQKMSRTSVNMAGLQTSGIISRDTNGHPTDLLWNDHRHQETASLQSHPSDAPTPPRRNGKRRLLATPRQIKTSGTTPGRHQVNTSVVVDDDHSIELQVSNANDDGNHRHHHPSMMKRQLVKKSSSTEVIVNDEESSILELPNAFAEEVATEYNDPKRFTHCLIIFAAFCVLLMLTAIIFAIWYLVARRATAAAAA